MSRLQFREEERGDRLLIIDQAAELTPEGLAVVLGAPLQGGLGLDGDDWVKALPYERTLVVEG